jgi:hypothetical protein
LCAEAAGGSLGARALVKRVALVPESFDECREQLERLKYDAGQYRERAAVALAMLGLSGKYPQFARLARVLCNAILADQADGHGLLTRQQLQQLVTMSGDRLLAADLPRQLPLPEQPARPLAARETPLACSAPAAGAQAILDAVPLADARYLLAHGEGGVSLVDRHGKRLVYFGVPAERLVRAHSGEVALALARRGDVWRVTRLDLVRRRADDLGVLAFDHHAGEFDGAGWTICVGRAVRVIDVNRSLHSILWQVTDLPGPVCQMSGTPGLEQFVLEEPSGRTLWRYQLPQRRLLGREDVGAPSGLLYGMLKPIGGMAWIQAGDDGKGGACVETDTGDREPESLQFPGSAPESVFAYMGQDWLLVGAEVTGERRLVLQLVGSRRVGASVDWPGHAGFGARNIGTQWLLFDGKGRLLDIDVELGGARAVTLQ